MIERTGQDSFKASDSIIKDVHSARTIYEKFRINHLPRMNLYAEIDGLIQGHPPYNPIDLRAAGLQHVTNFNDMSARAYIERACLAYFNLLYNSQYIINFNIRLPQIPDAKHYAQILSRNWHQVVTKSWPSFYVNICTMAMQLVKWGISPILFPDERSPKWRVIDPSRFFVPDQTQADLDLLTTAIVESEYTIQYLWNVYQEYKDKDKDSSPWNTKELGSLLAKITLSSTRDTASEFDVMEMERKLSSGDISMDRMFNDTVRLISFYKQEYSGKISHYMFHRRHDDEGEFLYKESEQYDKFQEAIIIFTLNPGEYTIHENKGIGHKIYSLAQAKIQAGCSIIDMVKWSSTPVIKSSSLGTKDVQQIKFYPGVPIDIGNAEFVNNSLGANVQHVVTGADYVDRQMQFNISYSGSDSANPDPNTGSVSPSQARLMAFGEFNVLKNHVQHFYTTFDMVLNNMVTRMLHAKEGYDGYEMAKRWKDRCIEEGVPEELFETNKSKVNELPEHIEAAATRAAGSGSQVAHLIGLQELQPMVGSFNEREARAFKENMVTATVGAEFIDTYIQPEEPDEASGGASLAGVENVAIQIGKSPIFSLDNEHRSHAVTHGTLGTYIINQVQQQQIDVIEADKQLSMLIPHLGQHVQALQANVFAQEFLSKFIPIYEQLVKYYQLNRKNAERAAQSQMDQKQQMQEKQEQLMTDEQLKEIQVMNDERRKDQKLFSQTQRQTRAGQAKEQALFRKTEADILINAKKVQMDAGTQRYKHRLDFQVAREKEQSKPFAAE